jgi:hypothetical protein
MSNSEELDKVQNDNHLEITEEDFESLDLVDEPKPIKIVDAEGRVLIQMNEKGRLVIGRYTDLHPEVKKYAVDLFVELTGKDRDKIQKFMDFDEDDDTLCV